jgi:hypothetical protein
MIKLKKKSNSSKFYLPKNDMMIKRKKKKFLFYSAIKPPRMKANINLKNYTLSNETKFDIK